MSLILHLTIIASFFFVLLPALIDLFDCLQKFWNLCCKNVRFSLEYLCLGLEPKHYLYLIFLLRFAKILTINLFYFTSYKI